MQKTKRLAELALLVAGTVTGDASHPITGVADIHCAEDHDISFLAPHSDKTLLDTTRAGAVIVAEGTYRPEKNLLLVKDPYLAVALIHNFFHAAPFHATGIHEKAVIGAGCALADKISIGPNVVLGDNVILAQEVFIGPGTVVGDNVVIGRNTTIHGNVTLQNDTEIGERVIIHSGTVIGSDGYGYATAPDGSHVKRPQVGRVIIEDDVEVGANACIDRATFGVTRIGRGTKIDNLVQVGHNVAIGENCLIVAQAGIAGSSVLGRNVILGGQAGISGHITLGDQVMVAAQAGVHTTLEAQAVVSGTPAIAHRKFMRVAAALPRLPDMLKELRALRQHFRAENVPENKDTP